LIFAEHAGLVREHRAALDDEYRHRRDKACVVFGFRYDKLRRLEYRAAT